MVKIYNIVCVGGIKGDVVDSLDLMDFFGGEGSRLVVVRYRYWVGGGFFRLEVFLGIGYVCVGLFCFYFLGFLELVVCFGRRLEIEFFCFVVFEVCYSCVYGFGSFGGLLIYLWICFMCVRV